MFKLFHSLENQYLWRFLLLKIRAQCWFVAHATDDGRKTLLILIIPSFPSIVPTGESATKTLDWKKTTPRV